MGINDAEQAEAGTDFNLKTIELMILGGLEAPPSAIAFEVMGLGTH